MALIDDVISAINATFTANLSWLDNAFGSVQKLSELKDGKPYKYPAVFIGENAQDYRNLLPDNHLGNYCYWEVAENQDYENIGRHILPTFYFKLVFWWDWQTLYPADWKARSIEEVKAQILNILVAAPYSNVIEKFRFFEDADTIYKGYTHQEVSRHFMMRPYGGLAIVAELQGLTACNVALPTPVISTPVAAMIPFTHSLVEQVWPFEKAVGGAAIYVRTWALTDGVGAKTLTGLTPASISSIISNGPLRYTDSSGRATFFDWTISPPALSTDPYLLLSALPGSTNNRVTIWYTKP